MANFAAMVYPQDFERKIGFDRIREILAEYCSFGPGREQVEQIRVSEDPEDILVRVRQTAEFREILDTGIPFPSQDYYDMGPALASVRVPGTYLEPEQLSELRLSLLTVSGIVSLFIKDKDRYPELNTLTQQFFPMDDSGQVASFIRHLVSGISSVIDDKSQVRSSASPELQRIRKELGIAAAQVEQRTLALFRTARKSGWTPEDAEVTIRNGQLVIPLLSTHKRKISGFVRDESATGHTVYLEPAEMLELNNEIRELELAERREIIRILTALTDSIRPDLEACLDSYVFLGHIDMIRAKARLAQSVGGSVPILTSTPVMRWRKAIHPLLLLSHRQVKKTVVPLDLELEPGARVLIISGPNAGGKSICLKTAGLVQYMFQCGLLPCVGEDSEFMVFRRFFLDIGDEQSLENDLSTYTSKLLNLKFFIEHLDGSSLFLIDEMGTGTDPSLGGTIAEASLEVIAASGAYGVVTTHYSNLKLLAGRIAGAVNGAMLFDSRKIRPLYKLRIGQPGSSFAFEIAESIGFPKEVLQRASEKTGQSQLDFHRQLQDLEVEKEDLAGRSAGLKVADEFLNEMISKYTKLTEDLERRKKEILEKARTEATQLLADSNKIIEKTIREIREAQAEKERTKAARKELEEVKEKVTGSQGHKVTRSQSHKVTESQSHKVTESQSHKDAPSPRHPVTPSPYQSYMDELNRKLAHFQLTLDVRGFRVDEAHAALLRYIDDAILLSIPEVRILHGKGNGILRQVTRDYLKSVKEVKEYRDEHVERGGSGITVVTFR